MAFFLRHTDREVSTCSGSVVAQPCEGTGKKSEMVFHSKDNFSVSQSQCHSVNRGNTPAGGEQTLPPYLLLLCFVIPSSALRAAKRVSRLFVYCSILFRQLICVSQILIETSQTKLTVSLTLADLGPFSSGYHQSLTLTVKF